MQCILGEEITVFPSFMYTNICNIAKYMQNR